MCNESKLKYKTMLKDDRGCPFWAAGDEKEEQQKEIIQNALLKMAKQIEEIALILTAEKNKTTSELVVCTNPRRD